MSRGINKVILVAVLGKDPETRYSAGGGAITNWTMATNDSYKDKETGERKESTEWHRCVAFGRTAEIAGEYLKKGSRCYVEGSIKTRSYEKDGQTRYVTEIVVHDLQLLDSRSSGSDRAPAAQQHAGGFDQLDDDIHF